MNFSTSQSTFLLKLTVILLLPHIAFAQDISLGVHTGLGYDSNAYLSGDDDYVDFFSDPDGNVTVSPEVQSGFYVPVGAELNFNKALDDRWVLDAGIDYSSIDYLDSDLSNADEYDARGSLGVDYLVTDQNDRVSHATLQAYRHQHDETYFDRDTGDEKTQGDTGLETSGLGERYDYTAPGFKIGFNYRVKRAWKFGISYRSEDRDHKSTPEGFEYDHQYDRVDMDLNYRINKTFRIALDLSLYERDYDDRHARLLTGQLLASSPLLHYEYQGVKITLKQRLNKQLKINYSLSRLEREDTYLGYNNFTLDKFGISARYRPLKRWLLTAGVEAWQQDYPNSWDFDRDPSRFPAITDTNHKRARGQSLQAGIQYEWTPRIEWYANTEYKNNDNTDERYEYDRFVLVSGIRWKL